MPLSAKFRREMLTAIKAAKKNKEQQNETEGSEKESANNEDDVVRSASILSKPVSSTQGLKIENSSNTDTRKPDKQNPIK
ncbi:unnamed protein product [Colias eurytheme]|nr:unnamed protein product [Colias eurytheme]